MSLFLAVLAVVSIEWQSFIGLLWWSFYAVRYSRIVTKFIP